jgi:dihydroneopterin aldolase
MNTLFGERATDVRTTKAMGQVDGFVTIFIEAMEIYALIGIHPHEREHHQLLLVDIELDAIIAFSGALEDSVDYESIAEIASSVKDKGHIDLVETYAYDVATACLQHRRVRRAKITVRKPGSLDNACYAGVKLELRRDDEPD